MTSVTISTTTVSYDTAAGRDAAGRDYGNYGNNGQSQQPNADAHDIGGHGGRNGGSDSINAALNNMNIPDALKEFLRKALGASDGESLPSEVSAVDTMRNFQNAHKDKLGLISYDQLQDVATGKTDEINGVKVPADVQAAAKTYMANDGALFNKVESAYNGKHDSQLSATDGDCVDRSRLSNRPTVAGTGPDSFMRAYADGHISPNEPDEYNAVKTMGKFQKDNNIGLISYDQMKDIASGKTDKLNGVKVPDDVRNAAETYVADHGALFDKIESATDGKHDSQLGAGDADQAVKKGLVDVPPMSEKGAVSTIEDFQKNGGPKLISYDEMQGIASGKLTHYNGKELTPEVKAAAQAYVANNGALFDKMESATDGKHDSRLGAGDPEHARSKGIALSDQVPAAHNDTTAYRGNYPGGGQGGGQTYGTGGQQGGDQNYGHYNRQGGDQNYGHYNRQGGGQSTRAGNTAAADTKAVETMENFQKNGGPKLISYDEMQGIASGKLTHYNGKELTPEVKAAAQTYVADNGRLFDKIESSTDGKHDSKLGAGDPSHARAKGTVGMSDAEAVDTIARIQKGPGSNISMDQMMEMAAKGTLDGQKVPGDVQRAAQIYMENNGALFKKVESATDGKHDGILGRGDATQAHEKGLLDA